MREIQGKYNKAIVYTDNIDEESYKQILNLMNQKFAEGSQFAIMPDCHAGTGCTIGLTMRIVDKVVPNLVGVDIGCSMLVMKLDKDTIVDLPNLDKVWHNEIPSGMSHRRTKHPFANKVPLEDLYAPVNADKLRLSIGTLGGGNHFAELNVDDEGYKYMVIHSGSRHLGIEICKYYQNEAINYHKNDKRTKQDIIDKLKAEGRDADIQAALKANMASAPKIPNELAYLEGELMQNYLHDMKIAQEFAWWNREAMMDVVVNYPPPKGGELLVFASTEPLVLTQQNREA
jgi:RNA-splicing ligase RtcB